MVFSKPTCKSCLISGDLTHDKIGIEGLPGATNPNGTFSTNGTIIIGSESRIFKDLAYSLPFIASSADAYITSLISKQFTIGFEPTFLQIPYLYSACDNLVNGKYMEEVKIDKNLIITTYNIPYQGSIKEEIATFITYFDITTNILFYIIPKEFSYNSIEESSISISTVDEKNYNGIFYNVFSF